MNAKNTEYPRKYLQACERNQIYESDGTVVGRPSVSRRLIQVGNARTCRRRFDRRRRTAGASDGEQLISPQEATDSLDPSEPTERSLSLFLSLAHPLSSPITTLAYSLTVYSRGVSRRK